jgi:hypothetical protein
VKIIRYLKGVPAVDYLEKLPFPAFGTTKKPESHSGLLATFYTENNSNSSLDAAPQIYAYQPHTV